MQIDQLKKRLTAQLALVQDPKILQAIQVILEQHLQNVETSSYRAQSLEQVSPSAIPEDIQKLEEEAQKEEKEQEIEDWLKNL